VTTETLGDFKFIVAEKDPETHIGRITFNRPDKLNAIHAGMSAEINAAIDDLEWDDAIKVIIFSGAGKAFSTGADLATVGRSYGAADPAPGEKPVRASLRAKIKNDRRASAFYSRFFYCTKVTIAAVQGYCVGGGFDIFLACDLSVVAEDAKLGHSGMVIGAPFYDISQVLWIQKLGMTLMNELCLTGKLLTAAEAKEWRIVNRVVPLEDLQSAAEELAVQCAQLPADGIVVGKTHRSMLYNTLGMAAGYNYGWIGHVLGTNMKFDPDEFNFFKQRRDEGTTEAFRSREKRFGV
jgi:enoyl-CoA hydratase